MDRPPEDRRAEGASWRCCKASATSTGRGSGRSPWRSTTSTGVWSGSCGCSRSAVSGWPWSRTSCCRARCSTTSSRCARGPGPEEGVRERQRQAFLRALQSDAASRPARPVFGVEHVAPGASWSAASPGSGSRCSRSTTSGSTTTSSTWAVTSLSGLAGGPGDREPARRRALPGGALRGPHGADAGAVAGRRGRLISDRWCESRGGRGPPRVKALLQKE